MPRLTLEQELQRLQDQVLVLGSMVGEALVESVRLLKARDIPGSKRLIAADQAINEKRFALENDILTLIATQQPMAKDLRILAAMLEIITELERIGDYAKGIGRINVLIGEEPLLKPLIDVPYMATKVRDMLDRALDAFVHRDVEAARAIPREDDEIDNLYNQVYRELLTFMMQDPHTIDRASYLLWVAHNLERAADRVTNICERVVFTVTGEMKEMDVERDWN
ncbi:MAG: phosphate signaling complex protein PhoU [Anaerolineae bacterium]